MLSDAREFLIKDQIFSLNERMEILNPLSQEILGYFHSKFFSLPKKYWLTTAENQAIIGIEKHVLTFMTKFDFYEAGPAENLSMNSYLGTLEKKFSLLPKYNFLSLDGGILYEVSGDFCGRNFTVLQNGHVVAEISRKFWTWTDTYGIRIDPTKSDLQAMILLTIVVVLDYIVDQQRRNH